MATMDRQEQLLTIQQLSHRLRIPKPTLRFWEKEFEGILVPLRTAGGQRRYTVENTSIVEKIRKFKLQGMTLADIKSELGNSSKVKGEDLSSVASFADKIAEVVRQEVIRFLERGDDVSGYKTLMNDKLWNELSND
ncbi:MAG: MerR family transcriptional regulator [Deltaproteobacteria bacterium]|nr:MerR family transcriptional regulator [Deltaproteobacteria bacterium]